MQPSTLLAFLAAFGATAVFAQGSCDAPQCDTDDNDDSYLCGVSPP